MIFNLQVIFSKLLLIIHLKPSPPRYFFPINFAINHLRQYRDVLRCFLLPDIAKRYILLTFCVWTPFVGSKKCSQQRACNLLFYTTLNGTFSSVSIDCCSVFYMFTIFLHECTSSIWNLNEKAFVIFPVYALKIHCYGNILLLFFQRKNKLSSVSTILSHVTIPSNCRIFIHISYFFRHFMDIQQYINFKAVTNDILEGLNQFRKQRFLFPYKILAYLCI